MPATPSAQLGEEWITPTLAHRRRGATTLAFHDAFMRLPYPIPLIEALLLERQDITRPT